MAEFHSDIQVSETGNLDRPARIQTRYQQYPLQLHVPMYHDSTAPRFPSRVTISQSTYNTGKKVAITMEDAHDSTAPMAANIYIITMSHMYSHMYCHTYIPCNWQILWLTAN